MLKRKLPLVDPTSTVALRGQMWNDLVGRIESLDNIRGRGGVQVFDYGNGKIIIGTGSGPGSLPTGQYQWMSYVMVSQNQAGWDFIRATPTL